MDVATGDIELLYIVKSDNASAPNDTHMVCNITSQICYTHELDLQPPYFERVVSVVVPILFGLISISGLCGNLMVIIVVLVHKQMRDTTNLLILNLAVSDLLFITICVPFTGTEYAMTVWPFGRAFCKFYQYMINVTAYSSVYTLILMSLDRYLAVVHPIRSISIRIDRNAYVIIALSWLLIISLCAPIIPQHDIVEYNIFGEQRSACVNVQIITDAQQGKVFYGCFFAFSYVLPLTAVCILYGCMLKTLSKPVVVTSGKQSQMRQKRAKKVTRMVIMVIIVFAVCWGPVHIILMVHHFGNYPEGHAFVALHIAANCLAYMNSCVNPFLYAFLSENFRSSFKRLLSCWGITELLPHSTSKHMGHAQMEPMITKERSKNVHMTNGNDVDGVIAGGAYGFNANEVFEMEEKQI